MSDQMEKNIIKILKNQEEQNKFNKNVLEKLDNLEKNQQVTNERLDKMEGNQQDIYERLSSGEYKQTELSGKLSQMSLDQNGIKNKINTLLLEEKETKKVVEFNTSRIINLETKLTDQIKALFDARSVNYGKHDTYEDHITILNSKIFNLDVRTSALEDYVKTLKEA